MGLAEGRPELRIGLGSCPLGGIEYADKYIVFHLGEHVELAQKHRSLLVSLEHRYYGASINQDGLTLEGIRFLSSQQA